MKKDDEIVYFDKEWKEMRTSLKSYLKKEEQADLHRFRVQVKKIRAFLTLSDSTEHHPKLTKYFTPVKRVFKKAGEIRNAYINQELGKTHQIGNSSFMSNQYELQRSASKKFKSKKSEYLEKLKKAHKAIKDRIRSISNVHISLFYQNQLHQIAGYLNELKFNDDLHANRKQVKILLYNHKLTHTTLNLSFNEPYMEQVQTAIGNWHDHILAMELFSNHQANDKVITARLQKQHTKLKNQITNITKDFYNRATTAVDLPVEQLS